MGRVNLIDGVASLSLSSLAVGDHIVMATYSGDGKYLFSLDSVVQKVIRVSTTITLAPSASASIYGQTLTYTAKLSATGVGVPTGSVSFYSGNSLLGTKTLPANGPFQVSLVTKLTPIGIDVITAVYNGDGDFFSSTGATTVTISAATNVSEVSVRLGATGSVPLQTAMDGLRLLPTGRNTTIPWMNLQQITITLNAAVVLSASDITVIGDSIANYGPVSIRRSGTTYTITLARPISGPDRVSLTIRNATIAFIRRLDVLPGDVNDDGIVNSQDAVLARNMPGYGSMPTTDGDIDGDGVVDVKDYSLIRARIGTRLPDHLTFHRN